MFAVKHILSTYCILEEITGARLSLHPEGAEGLVGLQAGEQISGQSLGAIAASHHHRLNPAPEVENTGLSSLPKPSCQNLKERDEDSQREEQPTSSHPIWVIALYEE
jgi:hypothetical protein